MADTDKKVGLTLGVKTEGTNKAVADLDKIAKEYADIAKVSGSVGSSLRLATAEAQKFGATDDELKTLNKLFNDYRKTVDATTDEVEELAAAQKQITNTTPDGGDGGAPQGSGLGGRITRAGSFIRSLPSVQIPGAGVGTDAVGNIARLSGVVVDLGEKSSLATAATQLLTPALGAQTAATVGATVPIIALTAGFAAVAIGAKLLSDQLSQNVDDIDSFVKAQRKVGEEVASGLTSAEAQQKIDDINKKREKEVQTLDTLQQSYNTADKQLQNATIAGVNVGHTFQNLSRLVSGDEQKLADEIANSQKIIADAEAETKLYTDAIEDGSLAANDAKIAEEELAKARTKAVLDSADAAGKELSAQQRALDATEEQNKERLETIGEERDVLQKQIDVLTESGDTSEQVSAKIAQLTGQLDLLGKESAFISDTALEASRQADAEKKAKKDAEDAAKKAQAAQEQYTKSVAAAGKTFTQSTEDIGTRFRNTIADNQEKFSRDTTDIATKYRRDELDLTTKAFRAERDAALDQVGDLQKIQEDANKDEQEAFREGDFKALFLARQKTAEVLKQEQSAIDTSAQKRRLDIQDARADLLQAAQRQRSDRMLGLERQSADARTAQSRELAQATLTRQRALQAAAEANNASLSQLQGYLNQRLKMESAYYNQSLGMGQGGGQKPGGFAAGNPFEKGVTQIIGRAIRK
jgi:hypothetical protein